MNLYARRQIAARINDIIQRNHGVHLSLFAAQEEVATLQTLLRKPLGEEGYLDFDAILAQYQLSVRFLPAEQEILFVNERIDSAIVGQSLSISKSFFFYELDKNVVSFLEQALNNGNNAHAL